MNTRDLMNVDDAYHYGLDLSKVKVSSKRKAAGKSAGGTSVQKCCPKRYICIDLEMTEFTPDERALMPGVHGEVIQFGAVMLDENYNMISKFSSFVKPSFSRVDDFIEDLTGITNQALENADNFVTVMDKFAYWRGEGDVTTFCWSKVDHDQLWKELSAKGSHRYDLFQVLQDFVDLQKIFKNLLASRTCVSLDSAVKLLQMEFKGQMHNAYGDAFNTARILHKLFCTDGLNMDLESEMDYINPSKSHAKKKDSKNKVNYGCSFASFMSPELLAQFGYAAEEESEVEEDWSETESPSTEEENLCVVDMEALNSSPLAGLVDSQEIGALCGKYRIEFARWLRVASNVHETEDMAMA